MKMSHWGKALLGGFGMLQPHTLTMKGHQSSMSCFTTYTTKCITLSFPTGPNTLTSETYITCLLNGIIQEN